MPVCGSVALNAVHERHALPEIRDRRTLPDEHRCRSDGPCDDECRHDPREHLQPFLMNVE